MVSIPPELRLDLGATFVPKSIREFLREILAIGNVAERNQRLHNFAKSLDDERKKIDAFKRELPLSMLLLSHAILVAREELVQCEEATKDPKPVLEEFIPMKKDCDEEEEEGLNCNEDKEKDCRDKKNWMSSVQLWSAEENSIDSKQNPKSQTKITISEKRESSETESPFPGSRSSRSVVNRAFVPFKPFSGFPAAVGKVEKAGFSVSGLTLLAPGIKALKDEPVCNAVTSSNTNVASSLHALTAQQQAARKQRRCWSPELHQRFVGALQQLGGSQVATPKQIRELMQVDGLTNDEVKSHLQKYRLHMRRSPKPSSSQSSSPQGPFQLGANGVGDESMEDDEDAKSEGYSWKSQHSQTRDRT